MKRSQILRWQHNVQRTAISNTKTLPRMYIASNLKGTCTEKCTAINVTGSHFFRSRLYIFIGLYATLRRSSSKLGSKCCLTISHIYFLLSPSCLWSECLQYRIALFFVVFHSFNRNYGKSRIEYDHEENRV